MPHLGMSAMLLPGHPSMTGGMMMGGLASPHGRGSMMLGVTTSGVMGGGGGGYTSPSTTSSVKIKEERIH